MVVLKNYEKNKLLMYHLARYWKRIPVQLHLYKSGAISIYKDVEDVDLELIRLLKKGM